MSKMTASPAAVADDVAVAAFVVLWLVLELGLKLGLALAGLACAPGV
jgi:hypothetical protein